MREIDPTTWNRRAVYEWFVKAGKPGWGLTTRLKVSELRRVCKERGLSYYQASIYILGRTANEYEPIRYRIRTDENGDSKIVVHDQIHPSCATMRDDGETYGFFFFEHFEPFSRFHAITSERMIAFKADIDGGMNGTERDDTMHGSVLPWIDFTDFEHAIGQVNNPSIPKYVFGKLVQDQAGDWSQAFSLTVHHGLMDGLHVGRFIEKLQANIDQADKLLSV